MDQIEQLQAENRALRQYAINLENKCGFLENKCEVQASVIRSVLDALKESAGKLRDTPPKVKIELVEEPETCEVRDGDNPCECSDEPPEPPSFDEDAHADWVNRR